MPDADPPLLCPKPTPAAIAHFATTQPPIPTTSRPKQSILSCRSAEYGAALSCRLRHATNAEEAARLLRLASPEGKKEYADYVLRDGRGLTEILQAGDVGVRV